MSRFVTLKDQDGIDITVNPKRIRSVQQVHAIDRHGSPVEMQTDLFWITFGPDADFVKVRYNGTLSDLKYYLENGADHPFDTARHGKEVDTQKREEEDRLAVRLDAAVASLKEILPHAKRGVQDLNDKMVGSLYPSINLAALDRAERLIAEHDAAESKQ